MFDIEIETDPFYLEGVEAGKKKIATLAIEKLLLGSRFSIKSIAQIVDETEDFVLSIKKRLIQEGRLVHRSKKNIANKQAIKL